MTAIAMPVPTVPSRPVGPYQERIHELLKEHGLAAIVDPRHVEAWMRCQFTTLDHLDPATFDQLANECIGSVVHEPTEVSERLALSFGLVAVRA